MFWPQNGLLLAKTGYQTIMICFVPCMLLHPVSTPCFYTLFLHPVSTPCFYTLFLHPVSTPCFYTLFLHPVSTPCFYTLFLHHVSTPCFYTRVSTPCFYTHLHTAHCNQSCDHSVGTVESHTPYSIAIGIHATVSRSNV